MAHSSALHRWRRILTTVAVGAILSTNALGAGPGTESVRAADVASDIPGTPLPGPIVAGRLGGSIYDVVYRLEVQPGYVIVASLTGAAGTDFDLYLFDSSATTVVSTVGLLTKSIGSTSSESVSWPSRFGGTYYLDLNGASDVEGDYRLTVQTVPDPTPPSVIGVLDGGRASTNDLTVSVALTARDDLSGISEMAFSGDGTTYTPWLAFSPLSSWTFGPGDGVKTLWTKVRNGIGVESAPATSQITIDTVQPTAVGIDPGPGTQVIGLRPTFRVSFSEPMDPSSWMDLGLVVQASTGELVSGTYGYDAARNVGTFTPGSDLVVGGVYVVTIGNVEDLAGNRISPRGSWTVSPLAPAGLTAAANPKVVTYGASSQIAVTIGGSALPTTLEVTAAESAGVFSSYAQIEVSSGIATLSVRPAENTTYRFSYAGATGVGPAVADAAVLVRRSVALVGRSSTSVALARVSRSVTLTGAVAPVGPGVTISFRLYRFDSARRAWIYQGSQGRRTSQAGRATLSWTPRLTGSYYWRLSVASTSEYANNVSPIYRWKVSR